MAALTQLEATTNDYFMVKGKKAVDCYFQKSFSIDWFLNQKKGIFERPSSGRNVRIPFRYDGNEAGFYSRGETISSDKKEAITAAYFQLKHAYGNATILRVDELENDGPEGMVNLVFEEVEGAQESLSKTLAESFYEDNADSTSRLTGLLAICDDTSSRAYGNVTPTDVIAENGEYPWLGRTITGSTTPISLDIIRTLRTYADYGTGKQDEPDQVITSKRIYNKIKNILQAQQMFTTADSKVVKAGFIGLNFEGADIYPCKYVADNGTTGDVFAINTNHFGFAVHKKGMFMRTEWAYIQGTANDKTMKIFFDGNIVVNNRRAHAYYSSVA